MNFLDGFFLGWEKRLVAEVADLAHGDFFGDEFALVEEVGLGRGVGLGGEVIGH